MSSTAGSWTPTIGEFSFTAQGVDQQLLARPPPKSKIAEAPRIGGALIIDSPHASCSSPDKPGEWQLAMFIEEHNLTVPNLFASLHPLENTSCAHACSNAHGHHAVLQLLATQGVNNCR